MKKKPNSNQTAQLQSRLVRAEYNIARLSETLYGLIERLQRIPDPPCPPMCGLESAGRTTKKSASKKKRS